MAIERECIGCHEVKKIHGRGLCLRCYTRARRDTAGTPASATNRRSKEELAGLDQVLFEIVRDSRPTSVRHVYYRMVSRPEFDIPKDDRGYRWVDGRLCKLRRNGTIPYGWLVDSSRSGFSIPTYDDLEDFITNVAFLYRYDVWHSSEIQVEVWCESRSLAQVLRPVTEELRVPLYPCGGNASIEFTHSAVQQMLRRAKPVHVVYAGDLDPAGLTIAESLASEIRLHLQGLLPLEFEHVGLTQEQVKEHGLEDMGHPRKPGEKRHPEIEWCYEAEALPAEEMRSLVRTAVERHLPHLALAFHLAAEKEEQKQLEIFGRKANGLELSQVNEMLDDLGGEA